MPSRHAQSTVYLILGRYYVIAGSEHPPSLRVGSVLRAACDQIDDYQPGLGYVGDALWRVEESRLAYQKECADLRLMFEQLHSRQEPPGQYRVVCLAMRRRDAAFGLRVKYRLQYLWQGRG